MRILFDHDAVKAFNTVEMTVEEMLEKYTGGINFFDNLDASWRGIEVRRQVVKYLLNFIREHFSTYPIIASGRFGMYLHNAHDSELRAENGDSKLIVVSGGLRSGAPMDDLSCIKGKIQGQQFVFIDDSFYSGKTLTAIKTEIERQGGTIYHTIVIYDGSKNKRDDVSSMFRYYDNYEPDGTKSNPNIKKKVTL